MARADFAAREHSVLFLGVAACVVPAVAVPSAVMFFLRPDFFRLFVAAHL